MNICASCLLSVYCRLNTCWDSVSSILGHTTAAGLCLWCRDTVWIIFRQFPHHRTISALFLLFFHTGRSVPSLVSNTNAPSAKSQRNVIGSDLQSLVIEGKIKPLRTPLEKGSSVRLLTTAGATKRIWVRHLLALRDNLSECICLEAAQRECSGFLLSWCVEIVKWLIVFSCWNASVAVTKIHIWK